VKLERRQPTRREWELTTSRRPVVRRVIRREASDDASRSSGGRASPPGSPTFAGCEITTPGLVKTSSAGRRLCVKKDRGEGRR
jgi:hypothetical protein